MCGSETDLQRPIAPKPHWFGIPSAKESQEEAPTEEPVEKPLDFQAQALGSQLQDGSFMIMVLIASSSSGKKRRSMSSRCSTGRNGRTSSKSNI